MRDNEDEEGGDRCRPSMIAHAPKIAVLNLESNGYGWSLHLGHLILLLHKNHIMLLTMSTSILFILFSVWHNPTILNIVASFQL